MRLIDILLVGEKELKAAGVEEYELDARLLLQYCLSYTRSELILSLNDRAEASVRQKFSSVLQQRSKRKPLGYILGEQEFWSLPFYVNSQVLIPRPETEFLIDRVLALFNNTIPKRTILDLCCGSGVIAIVLAKELKEKIIGIDICKEALHVASRNSIRHGLNDKVLLGCGNLFSSFLPKRQFSLIVSNPPYVNHYDIENNLKPEVVQFEPHLALDGGKSGLDIISAICKELPYYLAPTGQMFMEIGADQGEAVKEKVYSCDTLQNCIDFVEILKDYSGRDRVVHIQFI